MSAIERFLAIPELVQEVCQHAFWTTRTWRFQNDIRNGLPHWGARGWLAELATTCRAIREPAQKALFRHARFYEYGTDAAIFWQPMLVRMDTTPRLARYLTELDFGGDGAINDIHWHSNRSLPAQLVQSCGLALRAIRFGNIPGADHQSLIDALVTFAPRLRVLQLAASEHFASLNDLADRLLNRGLALESLRLTGFNLSKEEDCCRSLASALRSLSLVASSPTLKTLEATRASSKQTLHTLYLTEFPDMSLKDLIRFLTSLTSLATLTIIQDSIYKEDEEDEEDEEAEIREDSIRQLLHGVPTLRVLDTADLWGSKTLFEDWNLAPSKLDYIRFSCLDDLSAVEVEKWAEQGILTQFKAFYMRVKDWKDDEDKFGEVQEALHEAWHEEDDYQDRV